MTLDTTDVAIQKQVVAAIQKIVGQKVNVAFDADQAHQGQWEAAKKLITLSATTALSASNAFHEAFHAIYDEYLSPEQRTILHKAFTNGAVRNRIHELLKDSPEAWEDAKNKPDEMLAYGFQFWHAGELQVGPDTSRVLGWIVDKLQKVGAWLRDQPRASEMLEQIKTGAFADGKPSPVEVSLSKTAKVLKRVQGVTKEVFAQLDKLTDAVLGTFDDRARGTGIPALHELAQKFYTQVGEAKGQRGLAQEIPVQIKRWLNGLDKLQRMPAYAAELKLMTSGEPVGDQAMRDGIRKWLQDMHAYGKAAGIDMGYVEDFLPMSWDGAKIAENKSDFLRMLEGHAKDIEELNAWLRQESGKAEGFREMTAESIYEMLAKTNHATDEFAGAVYDERGAPNADFVHDRVFGFLTNADRAPFIKDDMNAGLTRYAKQMVKRAEWTRRMGANGEVWAAKLAEAKKFGATKDQLALMDDYKDAVFGAKLYDMNPTLRKFIGGMMVYQNYRVLSTAVLGSIIDPMGVAVRSGEWSDATAAYKLAIKRIWKGGREDAAALEGLAEDIGAIEAAGVSDALHEAYGGVNIEGFAQTANDTLFRYNGMNGLNRSVRMAALAAGVSYVGRHAAGAGRHSARNLAELGLVAGDVKKRADGRLAVLPKDFADLGMTEEAAAKASAKVQAALNRFVDESALRPNAGERTKWGADPIFGLLYHLKQYAFSFNKVINKKLEHEALEYGNTTPYMMAATYIPIMAGSAMIRDMIYNAGSLSDQKGFLDYAASGVNRSGLLGPGGLAADGLTDAAAGDAFAVKQLAGPTASQAMDAFGAVAANGKSLETVFEEGLPGGNVISKYMKGD